MPFVVLVAISLAAGFGQALLASHSLWPTTGYVASATSQTEIQRCVAACERAARAAARLPLWAALAVPVGGSLLVGGLALLLRSSDALPNIDSSAASWSHAHATGWSTGVLDLVTMLGDWRVIAALAALVLIGDWFRERNSRVVLFLVAVTVGNAVITMAAKILVDRARPALNPVTETLGPSFPSGHSSAAAAFYTAVALIVAHQRGPAAFRVLISCATGAAVAVACSRVLLEVHWVSDVVAGLALGWGWVACCVISIGVSARADASSPAAQLMQGPQTGSPGR